MSSTGKKKFSWCRKKSKISPPVFYSRINENFLSIIPLKKNGYNNDISFSFDFFYFFFLNCKRKMLCHTENGTYCVCWTSN